MIFTFLSIAIPILVWIFFPILLKWTTGKKPQRDGILFLACALYFMSWYLPSPLIHGQNTWFMTHLVGGGVFVGLLWFYTIRQMGWKLPVLIEMISLYAFVSAFGVANELFELLIVELGLTRLSGADTWWDLFANTLGAFLFWIVYLLFLRRKGESASHPKT